MIVRDLSLANDNVMREDPAYGFVEAAADGFVRHFKFAPGLCLTAVQILHGALGEVQRTSRGISLEVSARAVPLDGIAPFRNFPLELGFGHGRRLRQINLDAVSGGFDVTDVHQTG